MSRKTLCWITAAGLAAVSLGVSALRYAVLGDEIRLPMGPHTWKVTLTAQGFCQHDGRLMTATPLDVQRQHLLREQYHSTQMIALPPESCGPQRRRVFWTPQTIDPGKPFKVRCEFHCLVNTAHPGGAMNQNTRHVYAPPAPGTHLDLDLKNPGDIRQIDDLARELAPADLTTDEAAHTLFRYVDTHFVSEPSVTGLPMGAIDCLNDGAGDSGGKARLLCVLLRARSIPARLVTGVILARSSWQGAHHWVEAWVTDRWVPMCPFHHHYGKVPGNYLVFGFGDLSLVRGRNIRDLRYGFVVEPCNPLDGQAQSESGLGRFFRATSLYMLPSGEQRLVEFLLLLPLAALIVCLFRNVIGLNSFGTFAPALVGLAFRDLRSLPGIVIFVSLLLAGWLFRKVLDGYHLLQVPRVAFMLTLVVSILIAAVVLANYQHLPVTRYVSLFPMVILTGMIERFWTLETEDGPAASFKTLLTTILIAGVIAFTLSLPWLVRHLFRFPESLGLVMACQLLIGRYTGYRLTELFRFRDFLTFPDEPPLPPRPVVGYVIGDESLCKV